VRKTPISRVCSNIECKNTFSSIKSVYCSTECRKLGAAKSRADTNLLKFGVANPFQSEDIKTKIKNTNILRYGVDNPMQSKEINDKMHETILVKYGSAHALQNNEILSSMQHTMLDRYGGASTMSSDLLRAKAQKTNIIKYGIEFPSCNHITEENYNLLNNAAWLDEQNKTKSVKELMTQLGVGQSVINSRYRKYGIIPTKFKNSALENEVCKFLDSLGLTYIRNDRTILNGKEIDIFIPLHNLAIECNGSYWHAELQGKGNKYHLSKTDGCEIQEINLLHIWEHEWELKQEIIKSILSSRVGKYKRIYGRKCVIRNVSTAEERKFLNLNHIQGYCQSSVAIGLYYEGTLVSLMTFGKNRFRKSSTELLRYCNIINTSVLGASSKLFSTYIKMYEPVEIISYSHCDKFTGNMYKVLNFSHMYRSAPAYYYTKDYTNFENRMKYQKHKLPKLLEAFDANLTEWQNMQNNGYDRIWDCGNDVWKWSII